MPNFKVINLENLSLSSFNQYLVLYCSYHSLLTHLVSSSPINLFVHCCGNRLIKPELDT